MRGRPRLSLGAPAGSTDWGLFLGSAQGLSPRAVASVRVTDTTSTPHLSDLDGDGCSEILLGTGTWRASSLRRGSGPDVAFAAPVIDARADLDGDGLDDIHLANGEASAAEGLRPGPRFALELGCLQGAVRAVRMLGDLDGDGFPEVVLVDARGIEGIAAGSPERVLRVGQCLVGGRTEATRWRPATRPAPCGLATRWGTDGPRT